MSDLLRDFISKDLVLVNDLILKLASQANGLLIPEITAHIAAAGGKRLRPMLTLFFAQFTHYEGTHHINLATSVELIHTATLLHDDVIDQSLTRRNRPTANQKWGNKAPILVGDFLFSQAFELMVQTRNIFALKMLSEAASTISRAEVLQLEMIGNLDITVQQYVELIKNKTAILFAASCAVGAILGDKVKTEDAYDYGLSLGLMFQVVDDLLDYCAIDSRFGKVLGNDLKEKKVTLPIILLMKEQVELKKYFEQLFAKTTIDDEDCRTVSDLLVKYHIKEKSIAIVHNHSPFKNKSDIMQRFNLLANNEEFAITLAALLEEIKYRLF